MFVRFAWESRSMKRIFFPMFAHSIPILNADIVFATPPLLFMKLITFPIIIPIIDTKIILYFVKNAYCR